MVAKRSTKMGKLMPYVDVRSDSDVPKFESMVKTGPVYVLVYADWCGHCQRFKQNVWDDVAKSNQKAVNTAAVHYNMVDKTSMKNASIEGYPTLFEVKPTPASNVSTPVNTPQNKEELQKLVGTNEAENLLESGEPTPISNNNKGNRMEANSMTAYSESFEPAAVESLPPNISADTNIPESEQVASAVKGGGGHRGGSLFESLLKVSADTAHAAVLAVSASELSSRMRKRKTKRRRSGKKKQTKRR
jgi:thiol-disulfide isomerase/thioredoxin